VGSTVVHTEYKTEYNTENMGVFFTSTVVLKLFIMLKCKYHEDLTL